MIRWSADLNALSGQRIMKVFLLASSHCTFSACQYRQRPEQTAKSFPWESRDIGLSAGCWSEPRFQPDVPEDLLEQVFTYKSTGKWN